MGRVPLRPPSLSQRSGCECINFKVSFHPLRPAVRPIAPTQVFTTFDFTKHPLGPSLSPQFLSPLQKRIWPYGEGFSLHLSFLFFYTGKKNIKPGKTGLNQGKSVFHSGIPGGAERSDKTNFFCLLKNQGSFPPVKTRHKTKTSKMKNFSLSYELKITILVS